MPPNLKPIHGSDLPTILIRAAANVLKMAGDHDETVLAARLTEFAVVDQPNKRILELHEKYQFAFESWCLPTDFDPDNPEFVIKRLDRGIGYTDCLLDGDLDGSFEDWHVMEWCGAATEVNLPPDAYPRLAEEIGDLREWQIEEYCAQGGGVPFDLSDGVRALYLKHVRNFGANDNLSEFFR